MQGNCKDAFRKVPELFSKEALNPKHCVLDFTNATSGIEVPPSSSLWISDLIISNVGTWLSPPAHSNARILHGLPYQAHARGLQYAFHDPFHSETVGMSVAPVQVSDETDNMHQEESSRKGTEVHCNDSPCTSVPATFSCKLVNSCGSAVLVAPGTEQQAGRILAHRVVFLRNHAVNGAAVSLQAFATAEMQSCTFESNYAEGYGGAPSYC